MAKVLAIHIDQNGLYKFYLNAGYMLSYVKARGHDAEFFIGNANLSIYDAAEEILLHCADCIIFTLAKYNFKISISLALEIKRISKKIKILFGGFFASGNSDIILSKYKFDGCLLSEGEETLLGILDNIDKGNLLYKDVNHIAFFDNKLNKVVKQSIFTEQIDLNKIPSPYLEIIDPVEMNNQHGCVYVSSSRGCKFSCTYCYHPLLRKNIRYFDITHVVEEIKIISMKFNKKDIVLIYFWDDFFISDRNYTINLCKEIKNKSNEFGCTIKIKIDTRIDSIDIELLKYLKMANVCFIGFGLENTNIKILQEMNKLGANAQREDCIAFLNKFNPVLNMCKHFKINTCLYIINGWHNETLRMAKATLKFAEALQPTEIHQNQLTYYKGTKIYPKDYSNEFYLSYYNSPKLYKYDLNKIPDSRFNPFIEHFKSNYKFLILTGMHTSKQKILNKNYFQNVICEGDIDSSFLYKNCKMNSNISLISDDQKIFIVPTIPLHGIIPNDVISFKKLFPFEDKWHIIYRENIIFNNFNKIKFYLIGIKNEKKLRKCILSDKYVLIPRDICAIYNRCACEDNFRVYIENGIKIYSCKNGVLLGTRKDSAKIILEKYKKLKMENEKKYGCQLCKIRNNCSKCFKMLKIYGNKYCSYMKRRDINIYKKYLLFLEKKFYYGSIENSRDFYFVSKD